jgi:hypothetical protein
VAVGAVAGLVGGTVETDCACAVTLTPASNPTPKTIDLSKLCTLQILPTVIDHIYIRTYLHSNANENCASHKCTLFILVKVASVSDGRRQTPSNFSFRTGTSRLQRSARTADSAPLPTAAGVGRASPLLN